MSYFVAVTFSPQSLSWPQLTSFAKRVETLPGPSQFEMAILPPFRHESVPPHECAPLWDELADLVENYFLGVEEAGLMSFSSLACSTGSKSSLLGLAPDWSDDWYHCQEDLKEVLLEQGFVFKKTKNRRKNPDIDLVTQLPLARFQEHTDLEQALVQAQLELQLPLMLRTEGVALFEKTLLGPRVLRKFFTFSASAANLEIERYSFAG